MIVRAMRKRNYRASLADWESHKRTIAAEPTSEQNLSLEICDGQAELEYAAKWTMALERPAAISNGTRASARSPE